MAAAIQTMNFTCTMLHFSGKLLKLILGLAASKQYLKIDEQHITLISNLFRGLLRTMHYQMFDFGHSL